MGPEDYTLEREPLEGDVVSFSYDHQARIEIPTNPKVYRIRDDLTWQDVLESIPSSQFINGMWKKYIYIKIKIKNNKKQKLRTSK